MVKVEDIPKLNLGKIGIKITERTETDLNSQNIIMNENSQVTINS